MKSIHILPVFVALFCGLHLCAQEVPEIVFNDKLNPNDVAKVRPFLRQIFEDYQRYAKLYDEELGSNEATKKKFVNLFQIQESEYVFADFLREPTELDVYKPMDYANEALERGYSDGIYFQLINIEVGPKGIELNDRGYYNVTVQVKKNILNPYDKERGMDKSDPLIVNLKFQITVDPEAESGDEVYILSIFSTEKYSSKEQPRVYIAPMFGIGTGLYSMEYSDYWNENNSDRATLELSSALQLSAGIEWLFTTGLKKKAVKQRWGWILGGQVNYIILKSEMTNMQTPVFRETVTGAPNESVTTFDSWATIHVLDETTRMMTADVKLGMGWRATFNQQETNTDINRTVDKYVWINFKVVPSFGIFNRVSADGLGTYDGIATEESAVAPSTLRFLGDNAIENLEDSEWRFYGRGRDLDVVGETSSAPMSTFGLKVELSPTWYFDREPFNKNPTKWELSFGFDLGYQFISNFKHDNVENVDDDSYRFKTDVNNSMINSYASSLAGPYFMFRIGFNRRNQRY